MAPVHSHVRSYIATAIFSPFKATHALPDQLSDENALSIIYWHVQVEDADVLIPTTGAVDAQAIRSAKRLKLIVQPATGYSNIDTETAAELGIPVCTSPGTALHNHSVCHYRTHSQDWRDPHRKSAL